MFILEKEFLTTDTQKYIPIQMVKTNYGFASEGGIESVIEKNNQTHIPVVIRVPESASAVVMLIKTLNKNGVEEVAQIKAAPPGKESITLDVYGDLNTTTQRYWIYIISKEYSDGYVASDYNLIPIGSELNRLEFDISTAPRSIDLSINDRMILSNDETDSTKWYNYQDHYEGGLVWETPDNLPTGTPDQIEQKFYNLSKGLEYLKTVYEFFDILKLDGNKYDKNKKEHAINVFKVIDDILKYNWAMSRNPNELTSYVNTFSKHFLNSDEEIDYKITNNSYKHIERYGYILDRVNWTTYSADDPRSEADVYVELTKSIRKYTSPDVDWYPDEFMFPNYAARDLHLLWEGLTQIGVESSNPGLYGTWVVNDTYDQGGYFKHQRDYMIGVIRRPSAPAAYLGHGSGWKLKKSVDDEFKNAQNKVESYELPLMTSQSNSEAEDWWIKIKNIASRWYETYYVWLNNEIAKMEDELTTTGRALKLSSTGAGGETVYNLAHEATLQNIRFVKNMIRDLENDVWTNIINNNSLMLDGLNTIIENTSGTGSKYNTLTNITSSEVPAVDLDVTYTTDLSIVASWNRLNASIIDSNKNVKIISLNTPEFDVPGKYSIMVHPKKIEIEIDKIEDDNIIVVKETLDSYTAPNSFYGWNIEFRTLDGDILGNQGVIVGSMLPDASGQRLQVSPLINGNADDIRAYIWSNNFIPMLINVNIVEYNSESLSYFFYGKREFNRTTGKCTIYDHNGNIYKELSIGVKATDETDRAIVDFREPIE